MRQSKSYSAQVIPGHDIIPITPSDDPLPNGPCRALWIGVDGNINITTAAGEDRDNIPAQLGLLPIQCSKVRAGATVPAASNIWAIY